MIRLATFVSVLSSVAIALSLLACGNAQFSGSASDSGSPASDASDGGFTLTLQPRSGTVVLNGKSTTFAITLKRDPSFHEDIAFSVDVPTTPTGLDINVSSAANTGADGLVSSFDVSASGVSIPVGGTERFVLTVTGTATTSAVSESKSFPIDVENPGVDTSDAG